MERTAKVEIGIIGGRDNTFELRKILVDIMYLANKHNASKVDFIQMKKELHTENSDEFLDAYLKLTEEEKEELIEKCIIEVKVDEPHLLNFDLTVSDEFKHSSNDDIISISEINKRLKYEKNMMVKQSLQRQLGLANAFEGKHSKGCKRKRKKK